MHTLILWDEFHLLQFLLANHFCCLSTGVIIYVSKFYFFKAYSFSILFKQLLCLQAETFSPKENHTLEGQTNHHFYFISFCQFYHRNNVSKLYQEKLGRLFSAISLVPARITTFWFKLITSSLNLKNIFEVVCPEIPLPTKLLSVKEFRIVIYQPSVIESPIKTAFGNCILRFYFYVFFSYLA